MKKVILIILSVLLALLICLAVFWEPILDALPIDQSGWRTRDGYTYYQSEKGDRVLGWQDIDGNRYYFDETTGALLTGRATINGAVYNLGTSGAMQTGWIDGRYYQPDGPMAVGLVEIEGLLHHFDTEGYLASGWADWNGARYYFGEEGTALSGWQEIDGGRYYLNEDGSANTGWQDIDGNRYYLGDDGMMQTGWVEADETRYYLNEDGTPASEWIIVDEIFYRLNDDGSVYSGWLEQNIGTFYILEDGTVHLGWLEEDGKQYYFRPDTGTMAQGKVVIDDVNHFFTSTGAPLIMVNRWNPVPADYQLNLVTYNGAQVDASCHDDLVKMLTDCPYSYEFTSSYRSKETQESIWNSRLKNYKASGYSDAEALKMVESYVALPGTSEHQLGLAVDISGEQALKWLAEHCWEYGFILRYQEDKSHITGINYEQWHFRYVGIELSMELKDSGLCLEEYLDRLTNDGTTCGNPAALEQP